MKKSKSETIILVVSLVVLALITIGIEICDTYREKIKSQQNTAIQMLREQLEKCRQLEKCINAENRPDKADCDS